MGSTIFSIVGGFGGCTGLEDFALTVFSVVLSWLGGFFGASFAVFSNMLWWLSSFSDVLSWLGSFFCGAVVFFFVLLMVLALPPLVFSAFLEAIRD
jgi:hypothetical protein